MDTFLSPPYSLTPSQDELAVSYFMSSYTIASPFDYLPKIYNHITSTSQDAFSSAVLVASFASLSLRVRSGKLMNYARLHYSRALLQTNAALGSSNTVVLDSSLISVLLLGLYEAITFATRQSPASWTAHTLGAVELIQLRGTKQLETELGTRLFLQTCNNIRSSCIQRGVAVPDEFLQLYDHFKNLLDPSIPNVRIGPLMDKIASLKVRVLRVFPVQRAPGIIDEALELEKEARELEDMLPESWRYQVCQPHMTPSFAYQGLTHRYPAHHVARHWNILRIVRLFLNEVIWHMALFVDTTKEKGMPEIFQHCKTIDTVALRTTASANSAQIVTDILASAPQFLDESSTTFTPAARFLILPLAVAGEISLTPKPARRCVIWCLHEISSQARLPQALLAAKAVESGSSTDW